MYAHERKKDKRISQIALLLPVFFLSVVVLLTGCSGSTPENKESKEKVLVQIGDSVLTEEAVLASIPSGISPQDSAMLYDAIVQNWVERRLLVDVAALNLPTIDRIERMVDEYRMQLITNEYRRVMTESNLEAIEETELRDYYNAHKAELRLNAPLVKGVYLKVASRSPALGEIREWIRSDNPSAIEQLEHYGLNGAVQYDNFTDTWVSWKDIAEHIPYRFEESDGNLPYKGYTFEDTIGECVYFLHVKDMMKEGEVMPFEFACNDMRRILADRKRASYDTDLVQKLYSEAVKTNKLKQHAYVPIKFRGL